MEYSIVDKIRLTQQSNAFDADWYSREYPDVIASGLSPAEHYVKYGVAMGRKPSMRGTSGQLEALFSSGNPGGMCAGDLGNDEIELVRSSEYFDAGWYTRQYSDVVRAQLDPASHYVRIGAREGRDPGPRFSSSSYLCKYPDVTAQGINPLVHYILYGASEGRSAYVDTNKPKQERAETAGRVVTGETMPENGHGAISEVDKTRMRSLGLFDADLYLQQHPDIASIDISPLDHYLAIGYQQRKLFYSRKYDFNRYLQEYEDVAAAGLNPIIHYVQSGRDEGRKLFLSNQYRLELGGESRLTVAQYLDYKARRTRAKTVVATVNFDITGGLKEPDCIDPEVDYLYFGVIADLQHVSKIWEYVPLPYHIDDMEKLGIFVCYNIMALLPEYVHVIFLETPELIISENFHSARIFCSTGKPGVYVAGSAINSVSEEYSNAIQDLYRDNRNVWPSSSIDANAVRPSCLVVSRRDAAVHAFLSTWWLQTLKFDLPFALPVSIVGEFGGELKCDTQFRSYTAGLSRDAYRHRMRDYYDSIVKMPLDIGRYSSLFKELKVRIVVPVFNAFDDVRQCLASLETTTYTNYDLVLADDASDPDTVSWLESYCEVRQNATLLKQTTNQGYTRNVNNAIRSLGEFDYLILLNSDTHVHGNWIEKMLVCFISDPSVGIVGPLSNAAGWQSAPELRGNNSLPPHLSVKKINEHLETHSSHPHYPMSDLINGFCFCVSRNVLTEVGLFDKGSFPQGYGEEDDFCMRARAKGFKNIIATSTYVYHSKSRSFGHAKRAKLAAAGRRVLNAKYGNSGYNLLTESIGTNPLIETERGDLKKLFLPYTEVYSDIGEAIGLVETNEALCDRGDNTICIHLHLHFLEMAMYFSKYLDNIPFRYDLYITINKRADTDDLKDLFDRCNANRVVVREVENRGRDVFPFLDVLSDVYDAYEFVLHIHSKRTSHDRQLGEKWLRNSMSGLLYNDNYIRNIIYILRSTDLGLVVPAVPRELYRHYNWRNNKAIATELLERIGVDSRVLVDNDLVFPAGNMFWAKTKAFKKLFDGPIKATDFPAEPIPVDGTLAHALERSLAFIAYDAGFGCLVAKPKGEVKFKNERRMVGERLVSTGDVEAIITEKLATRQAFALIRYFDGEGAFYKSKLWSDSFVDERFNYYFGRGEYTHGDASLIGDIILSSLDCADVVGIPNLDIIDEMIEFTDRYAGGDVENLPYIRRRYNRSIDCNGAWRILSSFELTINSLGRSVPLCRKDIHYDLVRSGALYRLMDQAERISIIGSQPVAKYVQKLFGTKTRQFFVPQRALDNDNVENTGHYPTVYNELSAELGDIDFCGELVLVGAGPLGKGYCELVKQRNGVVLDVGAVLDAWVAFHSRPEHTDQNGDLENDLLLTSENITALSGGSVIPKTIIGIDDLPCKKVNKHVRRQNQNTGCPRAQSTGD